MKGKDAKTRMLNAQDALFYIDKISERLGWKLKEYGNEEFRILVSDETHTYNSEALDLAEKTFKRKHLNFTMTKYRKLTTGKYAYIFRMSKIKV